jgi:hypothetical protein
MQVLNQITIKQTHDERLKYEEYLRKVEEVKFEMAERYRLHPNNFVTKKNWDDDARNYNVPFYLCRNIEALVDDWDEDRMDIIGQNGPVGYEIID